MPANDRLVIYTVFLIYAYYGSSSFMGFFGRIFSLTWSMCTFAVATLLGRYLVTSCTVSTCHDWKYHFLISLIHVDLNETNAAAWRYLTKSV